MERWNDRQEPEVTVLGLLGQSCWARPESIRCRQEKKRDRLLRPRESQRWAEVFHDIDGPGPQSRWTYVADRESDIYEVFVRCRAKRMDFIIRANQPRAFAGVAGLLLQRFAVIVKHLIGLYGLGGAWNGPHRQVAAIRSYRSALRQVA
ncbi:MAG: hypothetical protein SVV80_08150 [Planctomycetota bacterium]|nr:hypothetical protein [Planctomycetota bacterium]